MPATACHGWTERFDQVVLTQADSGVQQLNRTDGQSQANDDASSTPGRARDNRPDGKRQGSTTSGGVWSGDFLPVRIACMAYRMLTVALTAVINRLRSSVEALGCHQQILRS
jgi:hypothetical protein